MLRAIFRRRLKYNTSGLQIDNQVYTVDFDAPEIEKELRAGGFSESGFEVRELIGVEVSEGQVTDVDKPAPVRDYKDRHGAPRKILLPPPTRAQELLQHVANIAHDGGLVRLDLTNALALIRRLTIRLFQRSETLQKREKNVQQSAIAADREYGSFLAKLPSDEARAGIEREEGSVLDSARVSDLDAPPQKVESEKDREKFGEHGRRHAYVDSPLKGKDVKVQLATLLDGPFVNQTACVYVEFADGLCIAEISIGTTNVLGVVDRTQMRFWEEAVEVRADGSVVFANDKEQKKAPQPDYSARADVPYTPDLNPPKRVVPEKAPEGGSHPDDPRKGDADIAEEVRKRRAAQQSSPPAGPESPKEDQSVAALQQYLAANGSGISPTGMHAGVIVGTLDAITLIVFHSGYRMDDEQRVNAIRRLTTKWACKFDSMPADMVQNFVDGAVMIVDVLRKEQQAELLDENDS